MKNSFGLKDPFLKKSPVLPVENFPQAMKVVMQEIVGQSSQKEALRYAYDTLFQKYHGSRLLTVLRLDRFFITDIGTLWKKDGFLHCNHLNYLLRTLLVASGQFTTEDIEAHWTTIWLVSPHQYLAVRLKNGEIITVDLWGKAFGIPFGSYAHGFRAGSVITSKTV